MVISVRACDRPPEQLTPEEQEEWKQTRVLTATSPLTALLVQLRVLFSHPAAYLRGLAGALRLAGWDLQRLFSYIIYFAEGVLAGHWITQAGYTHLHSHFASTPALLASRVFPLRLSLTIHGSDEFIDPVGFRMQQKVAACSLICAISQYGRSQIMRFSDPRDWHKIVVLPLGVDPSIYSPRPFQPSPETFEILSVGRLTPVKGLPVMLSAMELLLAQARKVVLRLVGDGSSRADLENDIAQRNLTRHVIVEGSRNTAETRAFFRRADIFALSSFAEGVPVVLMEAMAMEIPCVATRITGIPELIREGVDGLLVTPSSASELAQAIARLMDDAELRRRIGCSGRERVLELYDLNRNTKALAETFEGYLKTV